MMKGGKEEDKIMGPLFPRLHVNDADKGGPRAPPRNKMALYEQLSIPSQRFNQTAATAMPLPPYNATTLVPSASSSQGGGNERNLFSSFNIPQSTEQSAEMVESHSSDGTNVKSTRMDFGRRSVRHANHKSSGAAGSVAECSSLRPHGFSTAKNSCEEKVDDEDDFRVPTFVHSGIGQSNKDMHVMEAKRLTPLSTNSPQKSGSATLNSSLRFSSSYDKPLEHASADTKLRKHERNHTKETVVSKEHEEKSRERLAEPSNSSKSFSNKENTSTRNVAAKMQKGSTRACQQSSGNGAAKGNVLLNNADAAENGDALRVRSETCSKESFGNSRRNLDMADNCNRGSDKESRPVELNDADKHDEVSDTSMEDSISGLEISPDDVVGIIGPKQFWKARRAIVNQQRVFAVQVFELHRLIKVQKLIAASPHLLLEDSPYLSGSPQKVPNEKMPPESNTKPQSQIATQKDDAQKLNQRTECQKENSRPPPLPSRDAGPNKGLHHFPRYGPYSGNPSPPISVGPENQPGAWCYPPANHWLVPVMSPSEGLIYKPYTGLCPSAPGFMAPVYGSCGPLSLPPVAGDFMSAAYGLPATHQQQNMAVLSGAPAIAPNYFPTPYGLSAVNPNISVSAVEQVSPRTVPRPTGLIEQRSRSSCNMAIPSSDAFSGPQKFHGSKDSELQGSTASSPSERAQGGPLPLFPMAPAMEDSTGPSQTHGGNHQPRVIKVVPHNARTATESAARIFRSIQEERQQCES